MNWYDLFDDVQHKCKSIAHVIFLSTVPRQAEHVMRKAAGDQRPTACVSESTPITRLAETQRMTKAEILQEKTTQGQPQRNPQVPSSLQEPAKL